ncbi:GGDEF domain-containing protein [Aureimonas sp. AU40]|uniref:GGDEF domain-containing protein n=1 Tax=Aureimonas sp. AU40 TaxID=1637747 RepID=UPI000784C56B|nr:GGDEF domain-containing protein [Aureimonas sp. AU40]
MQADILAWAVPATFLLFGIAFAALGRFGPGLYAWSGCFSLAALAYGMTVIPAGEGAIVKPLFEDSLFLFALTGANLALASRAGRRPRYALLAGTIAASLFCAFLALFLSGSAQFEIFSIQAGCAVLMLLAAGTMAGLSKRWIDRALFWLCVLVAASLSLQNLAFLSSPLDQPMTVTNWRDSPWAFVFQLSGAVTGVLMAFSVLVAIGMDLIEHHRLSSDVDALTLVLNRRGFERRVAELRRAAHGSAPDALVLADLDFFKQINDRHGHEAGDAVICGFAALLERMVGNRGCVCRFGGEEFAVFLRACDLSEAQTLALRLQSALRAVRWPFDLAQLSVTASFGVVAVAAGERLWDAAGRADTLLYVAKSHGRDRVVGDAIASAPAIRPAARLLMG